jgi:type II secretory pathway pseudopilin PulG
MYGGREASGARTARLGFSLLELTIVVSVLMVAFLALSQSLGTSMRLTGVNRESALVTDAVRARIELLSGVLDFSRVFALYNDDPNDDPDGPGTAPGPGFAVEGLSPVEGDPDGLVGEVVFPTVSGAGGGLELREDLDEPLLGMPRDLDGDGSVDDDDHSGDYRILPVCVRLRWSVGSGERTLEVPTSIADR